MTESAYETQLRDQLQKTRDALRIAEDELAAWRSREQREDRLRLAWRSAARRAAKLRAALDGEFEPLGEHYLRRGTWRPVDTVPDLGTYLP